MGQVLNLALPFFALIGLGYLAAKLRPIPRSGLAWMNTFIVYVALPALFFNLLARTPVEELANWNFIFATTFATYLVFTGAFALGLLPRRATCRTRPCRGWPAPTAISATWVRGSPLRPSDPRRSCRWRSSSASTTRCISRWRRRLMAVGGGGEQRGLTLVGSILRKIFTHPFILATIVGVVAAIVDFRPPAVAQNLLDYLANAAAPCALFVMGVTVALSPRLRMPLALGWIVPVKLLVHPVLVWLLLGWLGDFEPTWVFAAVLLGALPTATNVFVIAQQYDVWVEEASSAIGVTTIISVPDGDGCALSHDDGRVAGRPVSGLAPLPRPSCIIRRRRASLRERSPVPSVLAN